MRWYPWQAGRDEGAARAAEEREHFLRRATERAVARPHLISWASLNKRTTSCEGDREGGFFLLSSSPFRLMTTQKPHTDRESGASTGRRERRETGHGEDAIGTQRLVGLGNQPLGWFTWIRSTGDPGTIECDSPITGWRKGASHCYSQQHWSTARSLTSTNSCRVHELSVERHNRLPNLRLLTSTQERERGSYNTPLRTIKKTTESEEKKPLWQFI